MNFRMIIMVAFSLLLGLNNVSGQINFEHGTWNDILVKAKKEKKKIFVDGYAVWCGPCKKMEATTFASHKVGDFYNKKFVCYKLNMESPEGISFGKQYPVSMYPTFLFFDESGKKLSQFSGYRDTNNFLAIANDIVNPEESEVYKLSKVYESGKWDKDLLFKLLMAKNESGQTVDPKMVSDYFKDVPPDSLLSQNNYVIFYTFHDSLTSAYTKYFITNYRKFTDVYANYASSKVDNLINDNIRIAAIHKDRKHLEEIKVFASNFVEKDKMPEFVQQIEKLYLNLSSAGN